MSRGSTLRLALGIMLVACLAFAVRAVLAGVALVVALIVVVVVLQAMILREAVKILKFTGTVSRLRPPVRRRVASLIIRLAVAAMLVEVVVILGFAKTFGVELLPLPKDIAPWFVLTACAALSVLMVSALWELRKLLEGGASTADPKPI